MRSLATILTVLALVACATPQERPAATWGPVGAGAGAAPSLEDLAALADRFPESAPVQHRLLGAAFEASAADIARAAFGRLGDMGYALQPASVEQLAPLVGDAATREIGARMAANRRPIEASTVLARVPADYRLVEGLAWDEGTGRLYASAVVSRQLLVLGDRGWEPVPGLESGSLFGLAVDPLRRLLWAASGTVEQTPAPETAFRGLIGIGLDSGLVARRVAALEGVSPADIAVAADGTVYASDPMGGGLYRLAPGGGTLEALVPPGRLRSPQGIAADAVRGRLYVSDYNYGIAIVDPATGAVSRLAADRAMNLAGTDALLAFEGELIAIQNGARPARIVRIRLDAGGTRATDLQVIERGHAEWGEPTLGQVRGDDLIYVADAQWERFGAGGVVQDEGALRPTAIRIVPLRGRKEAPPGRRKAADAPDLARKRRGGFFRAAGGCDAGSAGLEAAQP